MFKKWPRVENSYQQKFIDRFLNEFPELAVEMYVVTEKLHGSNMQIFFERNLSWRVGKRTAFLAEGEKFFNIQAVLPEYEEIFKTIQDHVNMGTYMLRLFGELVGPGVQKGVNYGKKKHIFFFGIMIDDTLIPFDEFQNYASFFGFENHVVPVIAVVDGLDAALEVDTVFKSKLTPADHDGDNIAEGVVIQPLYRAYTNAGGKRFLLKKKNEKFLEKSKAKKPPSPGDPEVERLNTEFKLYITENRLQAVFSKHGEIEEPKQIGGYIRLMIRDALEDFLKDHEEAFDKLNKGEQGKVTGVGKIVADMLKGYL